MWNTHSSTISIFKFKVFGAQIVAIIAVRGQMMEDVKLIVGCMITVC